MPKHGAIYPTTNSLSIRRDASYPSYPSEFGGPPVCTGTTGGGGAPVRRRAHPQSSFPQRREGGDGFPSPRERRWAPTSSFPRRRGAGDGFPSPRERRTPATAGIHATRARGRGWVPVSTGTTVGTHRHSRDGGNPWRGAGRGGWVPVSTGTTMGGGNPRRGAGGWVPVSTGTTEGHRHGVIVTGSR